MCSKNNVGGGGANRKACTLVPSQANGNDSKASLERDRRQKREGRDLASALMTSLHLVISTVLRGMAGVSLLDLW